MISTASRRTVPENIVAGLAWGWHRGQLRLAFPDVANEERRLLDLANWLGEDMEHPTLLAEYMIVLERQTNTEWQPEFRQAQPRRAPVCRSPRRSTAKAAERTAQERQNP